MKKTVISAIAALAIGATGLSATQFYVDEKGQVFTTEGEGRKALENKETSVFSKTSKLQFSGTHYLGFTHKDMKEGDTTNNFEMRRNYVQVKAYVLDDPKSYLRVTLDSTYSNSTADGEGHADVYVKYAYLYLNDILPYTGMEFGMAHRPWIDYEEHQGWWMRSISKVFVEAGEAAHLTNSADLGVNLKTKTPYFTSELGIFNGEGYHGSNDNGGANDEELGDGLSAEWRLTAALLGNGEKKRKPLKDDYFDVSFFGQMNMDNSHNADAAGNVADYTWYGVHTVYNTPSFLISAQYVTSDNDLVKAGDTNWNGQGYSVNGTFRFGEKKQFSAFARYDEWENEDVITDVVDETEKNIIYGLAWQQNKNFKWLLSGQTYKVDETNGADDWNSVMLTAEVHW
ncbi:MAG TPA: hypothetical protein VIM82_00710 [Sulfurimonas sp.]